MINYKICCIFLAVSMNNPGIERERLMARFSLDSTLQEVLQDRQGRAVLEKHLGNMLRHPLVNMFKNKKLSEIIAMAKGRVSDEQINAIRDELMSI